MHYIVLERWSRGSSFLHQRDARVKMIALLVFLVCIATTRPFTPAAMIAFAALALAGAAATGLPLLGLLGRACAVLPFTLTFAALSLISGDGQRAFGLVSKSVLSALGVLLVVATTPMPALMHAASSLGFPRILVLVLQFLYRYLFVITDQAQRMRAAALCRGAALRKSTRKENVQAAAGMLAVLFGRSYEKAEGIQRAMVARGFNGEIHLLSQPELTGIDGAFLLITAAAALFLRYWFSV